MYPYNLTYEKLDLFLFAKTTIFYFFWKWIGDNVINNFYNTMKFISYNVPKLLLIIGIITFLLLLLVCIKNNLINKN